MCHTISPARWGSHPAGTKDAHHSFRVKKKKRKEKKEDQCIRDWPHSGRSFQSTSHQWHTTPPHSLPPLSSSPSCHCAACLSCVSSAVAPRGGDCDAGVAWTSYSPHDLSGFTGVRVECGVCPHHRGKHFADRFLWYNVIIMSISDNISRIVD